MSGCAATELGSGIRRYVRIAGSSRFSFQLNFQEPGFDQFSPRTVAHVGLSSAVIDLNGAGMSVNATPQTLSRLRTGEEGASSSPP